jgi:hypothetical protein
MTSSGFALSAHNSDLVKKFQGNGWALTCSPASQSELSAILDDKVSDARDGLKTSEIPDPPLPEYESDSPRARSCRRSCIAGNRCAHFAHRLPC